MRTGLYIVLGVVGVIIILAVFWNVEFQWRLRKHHGMSRSSFLAYFTGQGMNAETAAAVYDYYRSRAFSQTFGISPEDEIAALFNQAEDDVEVDFESILKKLSLSMPSNDAWDAWGRPPVRTIEQLVAALEWASQHQPT